MTKNFIQLVMEFSTIACHLIVVFVFLYSTFKFPYTAANPCFLELLGNGFKDGPVPGCTIKVFLDVFIPPYGYISELQPRYLTKHY